MKRNSWLLVGIVVVVILFFVLRNTREHLTGQAIPTVDDVLGYPGTPGAMQFVQWMLKNSPMPSGMNPDAYSGLTRLYIQFVYGYGANYSSAAAPLSRPDFNKDFVGPYNTQIAFLVGTGLPGSTNLPAATTPDAFTGNPYADIVYQYYYGPSSATPYVAPPPPPPSTPTPPPPAPPTPSPAASMVPSQSSPADVPSPCQAGLKSIPGGSMEFKCFS